MIDLTTMKNNREKAIALINAGGATKQSLMDVLNINDKSLASLFSQLRLMGHFNLKNEDGTFRLGTEEEYEAARHTGKPRAEKQPKSLKAAVDAAQKRETRASSASTAAAKRYADDASRKNELRKIVAEAELELASILLGEAHQAWLDAGAPEDDIEPEVTEVTEATEADMPSLD